ncbi:MFS transporter [Micromonospora musae]|uniref:MFS transporter n=1 Tax=Micromonospora musae TaxID=1894970 RepID=UPI00342538B0
MLTQVQANPRRWTALIFISLAQLMVVLDATVVNIALPAAQQGLGISDGNRQWVITAYMLAFGGLLLFGGRIADLAGRKRIFIIGLLGFAAASAFGGIAVNTGMLLGARALQGVFGALLAPAALSLLAVTFTEGRERAKAIGVFSSVASAGGAVGLILGGVLTQYLNWRWAMFINIPIALIAAAGAVRAVSDVPGARNRDKLDIPGVMLATTGLVALVYGFTRAESEGWTDVWPLGSFAASAVLLAGFVLVELKVAHPLLPLRVLTERNRAGAYSGLGIAAIGLFGLFLFLTYYLQLVKGWSPAVTGLAFLPMIVSMIFGSMQIAARLMNRVTPRLVMGLGFLVAALGMLILTQLEVDSSYAGLVLPGMIVLGLGMGTGFMAAMSLATYGVEPRDAGVASAMINISQQVGGSIGTALLNTVAASVTTAYLLDHRRSSNLVNEAAVHGYATATWWAVGALALAGVLALTLVNVHRLGGGGAAIGSGAADDENAGDASLPVMMH